MSFIDQQYAPLTRRLTGHILELGCGQARSAAIDFTRAHLTAVDRSAERLRVARRREPRGTNGSLDFVAACGEALPFPDRTFDAVIGSFVFCSVDDVEQVAAELARVAKPSAALVFVEHVRSERPAARWLQDAVTPAYARVFKNCHLNRSPQDALRRHGFAVSDVARRGRFMPWVVFHGSRADANDGGQRET
jgi:ubiquinone/menaquinone biosynthesis C-methylase UbiE